MSEQPTGNSLEPTANSLEVDPDGPSRRGPYTGLGTILYHHQIELNGTVGNLPLHIAATFCAPWSILFGPSGSGKSSILRAFCGLLPGTHPRIHRGDPANSRTSSIDRLPPHRRAIAYAPQQPSLFPHLSVRENVAFSHTVSPGPTAPLLDEILALFELDSLADRSPRKLSGGERQRVNLARAFAVPAARLILLDEPFTGLDLELRNQLLPRMQRFLAARHLPCISVTHDVEEALLLDAEVFRVHSGRILAHGPAPALLAPERTRLLQTLQDPPAARL